MAWPFDLHSFRVRRCHGSYTEQSRAGQPLSFRQRLQFPRGGLDGLDDLVVARATAEVVGQAEANIVLRRIRVVVEQCLGGDQETGRADPALQRGAFQEALLDGMQMAVIGEPLDRLDGRSLRLDGQHEATVDRHTVEDHRAGAAVAVVAALFGPRQPQGVAENFQQALPRLTQELDGFVIHARGNVHLLGHGDVSSCSPGERPITWFRRAVNRDDHQRARSTAFARVRRVRTPTRCRRNSAVPLMSLIGEATFLANSPARSKVLSVAGFPASHWLASAAKSGVGATAARPIRACSIVVPSALSLTHDPAPATAMSISFRGMNRSYAEPLKGTCGAKRIDANISPFWSTLQPGAVQKDSAGTSRHPFGPAITHCAPKAISAGIVSAAGEELQRLPPTLARLWICQPPTIRAASARAE